MLTEAELTFEVKIVWVSGATTIMWVRSCPVPRTQSIFRVDGS
jgi:hypothetical protein